MRARDIMTTHPSVVIPTEAIMRAAQMMRDRHVGMLPVVDDLRHRRLIGLLTDRDVTVRCVARGHAQSCTVADHMTGHPLAWVSPDADVREVAARMRERRVRRMPVIDADHRVVGLVTLFDLSTRLQGAERELAGDVEQWMGPQPIGAR
ncbi:MAG TPA: CBS domain-containing protein [Gemmatimonadaceae bacterium]|nr:CBS domain-containing protein [Gemmatimonadaceae bacterium]